MLVEYLRALSARAQMAEPFVVDFVLKLILAPPPKVHVRPPPLPPPTTWTRRVPHPVLIGHVSSLRAPRPRAERASAPPARRGRAPALYRAS